MHERHSLLFIHTLLIYLSHQSAMLEKAETDLQNTKRCKKNILAETTGVGLFKAYLLPNPSIYG
jgi:hypothetical protein